MFCATMKLILTKPFFAIATISLLLVVPISPVSALDPPTSCLTHDDCEVEFFCDCSIPFSGRRLGGNLEEGVYQRGKGKRSEEDDGRFGDSEIEELVERNLKRGSKGSKGDDDDDSEDELEGGGSSKGKGGSKGSKGDDDDDDDDDGGNCSKPGTCILLF